MPGPLPPTPPVPPLGEPNSGKSPGRSPGQLYRLGKAAAGLCKEGGCEEPHAKGKASCTTHLKRDADKSFLRRHPPGGDYSPGDLRRLREIRGEPEPLTDRQRAEQAYNGLLLRRSHLQAVQAAAAQQAQEDSAALVTAQLPLQEARALVATATRAVRIALDAVAAVDRAIAMGELGYTAAVDHVDQLTGELATTSQQAADFEELRLEQERLARPGMMSKAVHLRNAEFYRRQASTATEKADRARRDLDGASREVARLEHHAVEIAADRAVATADHAAAVAHLDSAQAASGIAELVNEPYRAAAARRADVAAATLASANRRLNAADSKIVAAAGNLSQIAAPLVQAPIDNSLLSFTPSRRTPAR